MSNGPLTEKEIAELERRAIALIAKKAAPARYQRVRPGGRLSVYSPRLGVEPEIVLRLLAMLKEGEVDASY